MHHYWYSDYLRCICSRCHSWRLRWRCWNSETFPWQETDSSPSWFQRPSTPVPSHHPPLHRVRVWRCEGVMVWGWMPCTVGTARTVGGWAPTRIQTHLLRGVPLLGWRSWLRSRSPCAPPRSASRDSWFWRGPCPRIAACSCGGAGRWRSRDPVPGNVGCWSAGSGPGSAAASRGGWCALRLSTGRGCSARTSACLLQSPSRPISVQPVRWFYLALTARPTKGISRRSARIRACYNYSHAET